MRARALRQSSTNAEAVLWNRLRNRHLLDLKFRRQHPIGPYIADFVCLEIGLVIELDGGQHAERIAADRSREEHMRRLGFQTLRFWNHEVLAQTDAVMERLWQFAQALTPTLSRKREREQDTPPHSLPLPRAEERAGVRVHPIKPSDSKRIKP